jgi:transmembrane sensor
MDKKNRYFIMAQLIAAEATGSLTEEERQQLDDWLNESEENREIYLGIKEKSWYAGQAESVGQYNPREDWLLVALKTDRTTSRRRIFLEVAKYAAAILLLISLFFFIRQPDKEQHVVASLTDSTLFVPGGKGARLVLDDGRVIQLSPETDFDMEVTNGTAIRKQAATISYLTSETEPVGEVFNTIITEPGEEFSLILSDGSRVLLNAESEIRFPVAFSQDSRTVEIKGEAYFEVAHNNQRPFNVKTDKSLITVTGTSFNIKAYGDDIADVTTLVNGGVKVSHRENTASSVLLKPGFQARVSTNSTDICVAEVDTDMYTAWTHGTFIFRNDRLEDIMRTLKRWYQFEVEYTDESLRDIRFGARLDRSEVVNPIFKIMNATELISIRIEQSRIIVSAPNNINQPA